MSFLKLLFTILGQGEAHISVSEMAKLGNIIASIADESLGQDDTKALQKQMADWARKNKSNTSASTSTRNLVNKTDKRTREILDEYIEQTAKAIERASAAEMQQALYADRIMLKLLKETFYILESNLYERLAVYTPVDTGNLLASVYAKHIGYFGIQIGYNTAQAPYAVYVHEASNNRHPNGGIDQFLLVGFIEAWTQTMASAMEFAASNLTVEDKTFYSQVLSYMNYGIDISKDNLSVTISLSPNSPLTNLNETLHTLGESISIDPATARASAEELLKDYKETLLNYLNESDFSVEQLEGLSRKTKKKMSLRALSNEVAAENEKDSTKSRRARIDRLQKTAKGLFKFNLEDTDKINAIKAGYNNSKTAYSVADGTSSIALSLRIAASDYFSDKIVYPLVIDKVESQIRREERIAREQEEYDELYGDEDYSDLMDELLGELDDELADEYNALTPTSTI
jgi:hypothetical protein